MVHLNRWRGDNVICALTESRGGWESGRTQYFKWTTEGMVKGF